MPHYQERLEKDLAWIEELVTRVGAHIEKAIDNAVRAALHKDRDLAADVIIGDYTVNRQARELDRLSHAFVARHLPSAGHLRFISAVLRLNIALERIGDYACTIARTATQLQDVPPPVVARDMETMSEHARRLLRDSLRSFHRRDPGLADATWKSATQFASHFDRVFADLVQEGEKQTRPVSELFSFLATFNRLERVIHQAKNICEETAFAATGKTKGEKTFDILIVDERNDGPSQLTEHFMRKAFPNSGQYRSAGWDAAEELDRAYVEFGKKMGIDMEKAWPTPLSTLQELLSDFHVIIGLSPKVREILQRPPFHTTVLVWNLEDAGDPEEVYKAIAPMARELMERLRGEAAN